MANKFGAVMVGSEGADTLGPPIGVDARIIGLGGDDVLVGGLGADLLKGGCGNDELISGFGNDTLNGGPGRDTFDLGSFLQFEQPAGLVASTALIEDLSIGEGVVLPIEPGSIWFSTGEDASNLAYGEVRFSSTENNITQVFIGATFGGSPLTCLTLKLVGQFAASQFAIASPPGVGSNTLLIHAVPGTAHVFGDRVIGSEDADTLTPPADMTVSNAVLWGLGGDDVLHSSSANDSLRGGEGNDTLDAGLGNDTLNGGAGFDSFEFFSVAPKGLAATALIEDLAAGDCLVLPVSDASSLWFSSGDDTNELAYGEVRFATPVDGITRVFVGLNAWDDTLFCQEIDLVGTFEAGQFRVLQRDPGTTSLIFLAPLFGTAGGDFLQASLGVETLIGGDGQDHLGADHWDSPYSFMLQGNAGNDDLFVSGYGDDTLLGGAGQDELYGGDGPDELFGGEGNDTLFGGYGNDTLNGGGGFDEVHYDQAVVVDLVAGTASGALGQDLLIGIEHVFASGEDDVLLGNAANNILDGGWEVDNSDLINGRGGDDVLLGGGSSTLLGGAGHDHLEGGSLQLGQGGDDVLGGALEMRGGDGNDTYTVSLSYAAQKVVEGKGAASGEQDVVYSFLDAYVLPANVENGVVAGYGGDLTGNALANVLTASAGYNILKGGVGSDTVSYATSAQAVVVDLLHDGISQNTQGSAYDTLFSIENLIGSEFNDTLTGNAQNNVLSGGRGQDVLQGMGGNDRFVFAQLDELADNLASADTILDFGPGDRIDLSGIDADSQTATRDSFVGMIDASAEFTQPGQLKFADGALWGNTDDDATAEFVILLVGVSSLQMTDIIT